MSERRTTGSLGARGKGSAGHQSAQRPADEPGNTVPSPGLAGRLSDALRPVRPSAAFVSSLGRELVHDAAYRIEAWKKRRRSVTIVAAVAGTLLSVASLIGAAVYLSSRSRARAEAGAARQES